MVVVVDTVSATPLRPRHPEKVNRPDAFSPPKPDWIRVRAPNTRGYAETRKIVKENGLVTVCEEAGCPNIGECWDKQHATFMIMGDTCTRACACCNVKTGMPGALDALEPEHVAEATFKLGLAHIVVTSVDRDDLADGGAAHFAQTIGAIRARCPATTIEILTPDFLRKEGALEVVVAAKPDVFNHNLETVPSRRSEEHTSELQSLRHLVCRLLLEKKKTDTRRPASCPWGKSTLSRPPTQRSSQSSAAQRSSPSGAGAAAACTTCRRLSTITCASG